MASVSLSSLRTVLMPTLGLLGLAVEWQTCTEILVVPTRSFKKSRARFSRPPNVFNKWKSIITIIAAACLFILNLRFHTDILSGALLTYHEAGDFFVSQNRLRTGNQIKKYFE